MTAVRGRPWAWVPSLYFAQGLPFVVAMTVSVVMYKRLGISNADIAFYTSWLYLPWVIKPFWSPLVDLLGTRRTWIVATQLLLGAGFAAVALTLPGDRFFAASLAVFWLLAFSSATHDIAADGFYIVALDEHDQAFFVGIRSTCFRVAMIAGQGLLVMLAGYLETSVARIEVAWSITFCLLAVLFITLAAWHGAVLPRPGEDRAAMAGAGRGVVREFGETIASFFRRPDIVRILAFLLLYRFAESQLVKLATPFLLDSKEAGGLGLGTAEVGFAYGTLGVLLLLAGGILGGFAVARDGLARWIGWMALAINLPNAVYLLLAWRQPSSLVVINLAVAAEQFGYGFGFAAYLLFMIRVARGPHATAHYAICTGFMALGMMLPGMLSGWLQEWLGYRGFFAWILVATVPSFLVVRMVRRLLSPL